MACVIARFSMGFVQGSASACVFWHREKHIVVPVHGGDSTAAGLKSFLNLFDAAIQERYELTVGCRIGPGTSYV